MTAETAPTPEIPASDVADILQATSRTFTVNGVECRVRRLKTREFLGLMRVLVAGFGQGMGSLFSRPAEQLPAVLSAGLIMAIPEAATEWLVFCKSIVEPVDPSGEGGTDDKGLPISAEKKVALGLINPEIEESLNLVEIMVEQEAPDLSRLGKVAVSWWETMRGRFTRKQEG